MTTLIKGIPERDDNGGFIVLIDGRVLSPKKSQQVFNHSPDGFAWGYGGSGPAQLALAILLEFVDEEIACRLHQKFKWDVIAKLPQNQPWELSGDTISDWLKNEIALTK